MTDQKARVHRCMYALGLSERLSGSLPCTQPRICCHEATWEPAHTLQSVPEIKTNAADNLSLIVLISRIAVVFKYRYRGFDL